MKKALFCLAFAAVLLLIPALLFAQAPGNPPQGPRHDAAAPGQNQGPARFAAERPDNRGPFGRGFMPRGFGMQSQAPAPQSAPVPSTAAPNQAPRRPFAGAFMHSGHLRLCVLVLAALTVVSVIITLFWILPIVIGLRIARRKNLSALWMLFAIHPLGGWITCLVLALCKHRIECASCGAYLKCNLRLCPLCHSATVKAG